MKTRIRTALATTTCLLASVLGTAVAANSAAADTPLPSCVSAGTTIKPGQYLATPTVRVGIDSVTPYRLIMQGDGNLVEYDSANDPLWATQTSGNPGASAVLQGSDGNLVVYSASGRALWAAYPGNAPGDRLCMQGDGNVVVYAGGAPLWATMSGPLWPRGNLSGGNYYPYGQCTWWAEQQAANYSGSYPRINGNALSWATNAAANGWHVDSTPHIGSIAVFQPGVAGADRQDGHVAWVTEVYPSRNAITITEMNVRGLGVVDTRTISPAFGVNGLQYISFLP